MNDAKRLREIGEYWKAFGDNLGGNNNFTRDGKELITIADRQEQRTGDIVGTRQEVVDEIANEPSAVGDEP